MPSLTAPDRSRRKNVLRRDATIGSAEREIARVFGIPDRCVRLVNKNGRKVALGQTRRRIASGMEPLVLGAAREQGNFPCLRRGLPI